MLRGLALLLALGLPAASAGARAISLGPMAVLGTSDAHRWIAWMPDFDRVRLLDARSGELRDLTIPERCEMAAIGADRMLWNCYAEADPAWRRPLILDLRTGVARYAAGEPRSRGPDAPPSCDTRYWWDIGRHWLRGSCDGYRNRDPIYLDWRSGERRGRAPGDDPRRNPDLDRPDLSERLCSPLRRHDRWARETDDVFPPTGDHYDFLPYERPFALVSRADSAAAVRVGRCGTRRTRTLDRCPHRCESVTFEAGLLSWIHGDRVRWATPGGPAHTIGAMRGVEVLVHAGRLLVGFRRFDGVLGGEARLWRLPGAPAIGGP